MNLKFKKLKKTKIIKLKQNPSMLFQKHCDIEFEFLLYYKNWYKIEDIQI